ncbi:Biopolymer transport protein ExbD/TolR (plasmid) [Roseivivax sp. THAF40]|uniref:ExbD/TolR family protein n=1 Tax=unclassified Roseivivax TaxID=2639302 RepID=UPI001267F329|nr:MULTISPECIES: biopolymer transporter ExbD [unclassified Roseivivax]QFS84874.1 Biopolymer transport protein ExbD/TolR [Roseivivax sp. THAF197b]QFT48776.1 Biopolymer transport protein ExbD/TolR [Roseivivax sp. THAF40]
MRRQRIRTEREPTIALINIVFLMLIFFLVAGTLAPPLEKELRLVKTAELEGSAPADALVLHADGRMTHRGVAVTSVTDFVAGRPEESRAHVRIVPDRALSAADLVTQSRALRNAGAERVFIVTERGLE